MKNTKIKGIVIALVILILAVIPTLITTALEYDNIYEIFSDEESMLALKEAENTIIHDMTEKNGKYTITGKDAYIAYMVETVTVRGIYLEFAEEFDGHTRIQIYTCTEKGGFSEEKSKTVTLETGEKSICIPIEKNQKVKMVRIDIMADADTTFALQSVQIDTKHAQGIMGYIYVPLFLMYLLIAVALFGILKFRHSIFEYFMNFNEKQKEIVAVLGFGLILILAVFGLFFIGKYNLTPTNFMYRVAPWNSLGVEYGGPFLSDPADSVMPLVSKIYYSGKAYSLWNSSVAFGVGENLEILWYPLNWVYFLPMEAAILIKQIIKVSIAYLGMYFLGKKLKLSVSASIFSGILYACSSAMVVWFFWPHTDVMMFAPWVFLLGYNLVYQQKIRDALWLGVIVWLMIVPGMPTFAAYVIYLVGFFILFMTIAVYRKQIKAVFKTYILFGVAITEGVLLSIPYILSLMGNVISNGYADSRKEQGRFALGVEYLRSVFFPYCRENFSAHINETSIYFGIAGIILVGITVFHFKQIKNYFWLISAAVLNILVWTHWLDDFYMLLPAVNTSSKIRLINLLAFVLCVLAGMGIDLVWKKKEYLLKKKSQYIRMGIYAVVIGWCSWYVNRIWEYVEVGAVTKAYVILLLTIASIEIMLRIRKEGIRRTVMVGVLIMSIVDMSNYMFSYLPRISGEADIIPEATDSIRYMQENMKEERFFSIGDWVLFPETNIYYGLNSITSHNFVNTNEDMKKMLTAIDANVNVSKTASHGGNVDNYELLKWCGVKYIVTERVNPKTVVTEGELVYEGKDGLDIYKLSQYADKLFLSEEVQTYESNEDVFENMSRKYYPNAVYLEKWEERSTGSKSPLGKLESLEVIADNEDYIKANVTIEEERFLVLNEYDDGSWEVYIDGEKAELQKVNYLFKAVYVPTGQHVVEFIYNRDVTIYLSIFSGVLLFIIMVAITGLQIYERKKRKLK